MFCIWCITIWLVIGFTCGSKYGQELRIESTNHWNSLNRPEFIGNLNLDAVFVIGNTISELGVTIKNHRKLKELHLCDNPYLKLHDNDIVNLESSSLESFHLDGCDLDNIPDGSFALLPSLTELNLERNHLKTIPYHVLQPTNISSVSLSGNVKFNFNPNTWLLASRTLSTFRCNGCGINVIYEQTFERLPVLRRLELNQNQITVVYSTAFTRNIGLSVLQLNENRLTSFPVGAFKSPPLRELCLDGNNFTTGISTNILKQRYARYGWRDQCPTNVSHKLDDIEDARLPGISDAFIATYLVLIVVAQGVVAVLLVVLCLRQMYRKKDPTEWDYASGVLNESDMYRYIK